MPTVMKKKLNLNRSFYSALSKDSDKAKWSRIVKLVFLPIVRQWLGDLARGVKVNLETGLPWAPGDIEGSDGKLVDLVAVDDFNRFLAEAGFGEEFFDLNTPIKYDPKELEFCIKETLACGLEPLAKYVTAFEVDLISLSGKPSELPQVKDLVDEIMPILPQRVVPLKDYPAGDWYPMSHNNLVSDAKSVTAVGAALYLAIRNGLIENWNITEESTERPHFPNYWGLMPPDPDAMGFGGPPFLNSDENTKTVQVLVNSYIGRQRFLSQSSRPEQQYKLVWADPETKREKNTRLEVTFVRKSDPDSGADVGLKIESCRIPDAPEEQTEIHPEDLKLQLCTLEGGEFWIDSGRFEIQWGLSVMRVGKRSQVKKTCLPLDRWRQS